MENMSRRCIVVAIFSILLINILLVSACVKVTSQQGVAQQLSIQSLNPVVTQTVPGGTVAIASSVVNPGNSSLNYQWSATGGGFGGSGQNNIWQAPSQPGVYEITLVVDDGKGGMAQAKTSVTVSSNRAPVIVSLNSERDGIMPGGSTTITCIANDPDGDTVRYSFNAADGSVSGSGNKVSWVAPNSAGDIGITCVVSDGKGGESKQTVVVRVVPTTGTATISLVRSESGTISSSGDKDSNNYRAGDDDGNTGYRAFFSFDIFSLNRTNVRLAKLKFGPGRLTGDPFNALGGLRVWKVSYGQVLPDYNITGDNLFAAGPVFTSSPNEVDVTAEVTALAAAGVDRLQLEALFLKGSNSNNSADYIQWPELTLLITFAP